MKTGASLKAPNVLKQQGNQAIAPQQSVENATITSRNHTILHLVFLLSLLTQKENVHGSHSVQTEKGRGGLFRGRRLL